RAPVLSASTPARRGVTGGDHPCGGSHHGRVPDGRNRGTRPGAARTAETGARPGAARLPGPPPGAAPRAPRRVAPPPPSPARPLVPPGPSFRPAARPCGRRTVRPSRAGQWTSGGRPPHGGRVTSAVLPPAVVRGPGVEGRRAPAP